MASLLRLQHPHQRRHLQVEVWVATQFQVLAFEEV